MSGYYIFTFGYGQDHAGKYVKVKGSYNEARKKMVEKYGRRWAFQYSEVDWEMMKVDPDRSWSMEEELETIE